MADSLKRIVLRGAGLEASVSPLGATLTSLLAPDRSGALAGASPPTKHMRRCVLRSAAPRRDLGGRRR